MKLFTFRPRQPLIGVALAALFGIVVAECAPVPLRWALLGSGVVLGGVLRRPRTWSCLLFAAVAFFALHLANSRDTDARRLAARLTAGARLVRATGVVWSVPEPPAVWSRTVTARFRLKLESLELDGQIEKPSAFVNVSWSGPMPTYGDRVQLMASARNIGGRRNPGEFDTAGHLQRQGVFSELITRFANDCAIVAHGHGARAQVFAFAAQRWIRDRLELDLKGAPEITMLIESMVLGLHGDTPPEMKEMFQRTGTLHLFAVSGLNVAMLAAIAWYVLKPLRFSRKAAVFVIVPLLCAYALVTGLSASCVRATVMATLLLVGFLFDRPTLAFNSLAAAGLLILAWDTNQLFSPGFQFSFWLVIVIVWLARRIQMRCEPIGRPDTFLPRLLWSRWQKVRTWCWSAFAAAVGVTLSAWLGSLIFTAGYFHLFSIGAIVANLLAVPLAFIILALALTSVLAASISVTAVIWCNNANWFFAHALLGLVRTFAQLPGGHVYVELPTLRAKADCEITVLDLGAGGAAHLRAGRVDWLLDCGHAARYPHTALPYLRSRGVNRLDGLLLTHGDAQHIGAALPVLADFAPRMIVDSPLPDRSAARRVFLKQLAAEQRNPRLCARGDVLTLAPKVTLRVLYPPVGLVRSTADDKALVVLLESGANRVLFTSDSGFATETWLVQNEPDLRADLLIKGQHAKDFSGTPEFLARVQPKAIICSGPDFGESAQALDLWAESVAAKGIAIFRQDDCGAAQIEVRGDALSVRGFLNGQTFRSRAR